MFIPLKTASAVLLCAVISSTVSAAGQRQVDAHIHGEGQLNFAVDGKEVHLELDIPANDILGFESIHTDKQRKLLKEALEKLESPSLWQFNSAAQCRLVSAKSSSGEKLRDQKNHYRNEASGHLDISAKYQYHCESPEKLNSLKTTLFNRFSNSEELGIQGFTDKGQISAGLTRKNNEVKF